MKRPLSLMILQIFLIEKYSIGNTAIVVLLKISYTLK